jgi:hypothetical protein
MAGYLCPMPDGIFSLLTAPCMLPTTSFLPTTFVRCLWHLFLDNRPVYAAQRHPLCKLPLSDTFPSPPLLGRTGCYIEPVPQGALPLADIPVRWRESDARSLISVKVTTVFRLFHKKEVHL